MWTSYLIYVFIAIGLTFNGLGVVGLLRFPDVYTRLHAATKATTFGSIFTSLGVVTWAFTQLYLSGNSWNLTLALHSLIAIAALLLTNPVGAHAIARAAYKSGVKPKYAVVDRLEVGK
ncbi:monovalent cation/proton antiporter, MnhG/PhaG subunit [Aciduliprofundum sp. MAR08-339]|uniref:monovalent cation/H(+) antiporter subunit G n=1 Tax=Aciduliprofundum sp. (strain MAR08-339) TaxID=673860 RepID=UPI0002A4C665|nr:monovalent cation/proton antiporter, MnhG/PhaG subunit [Aciduliprofundum sp. MAR08-339]